MRSQQQPSTAGKQDAARVKKPAPLRGTGAGRALGAGRSPAALTPEAVLELQRSAGNAAVARRMAPPEQHEHNPMCGHGAAPSPKDSSVHKVLATPGKPLDAPVQRDMEARLNANFSDVRLHDDSAARQSTAEVGARAFTSGNHVVLGPQGKDPLTLAHELTHVIQQRSGPVAGTDNGNGVKVSDPSDKFEREAEANAARVMSAPAPVAAPSAPDGGQAAGGAVQRAEDETAV
ncbi:DUF4157 domain-containing protein [Streptomyces sp. CWNU-52B]|uniref:eCIS core domain-containing protein n=1 Tax=unclassified Streptomyces TaxID=2593676 RepID=UPI0039C2228F